MFQRIAATCGVTYVNQQLWEHFHAAAQVVQTHMVTHHRRQHLQARHDAVTSGGFVQQDHMTRVFGTDTPAFFLHFFQHIAVANFRPSKRNTQLFQRQLEAHVAHQRTYRTTTQLSLTQGFTGDDVHDLIAIDLIAFVVNHNNAVAIAVQRNTQIGFFRNHARLQGTDVSGADFFIDVHTVWLTANGNHVCTQLTQYIWCNVVRCTVSAIHHNFKLTQTQFVREGAFAKLDIATGSINDTGSFTQFSRVHAGDRFFHFGFDSFFNRIRQFGPIDGEEFNPIVIEWVVRSGDNNPGLSTESTRQISNGRCWHWPCE